jgi:hypothetical protein
MSGIPKKRPGSSGRRHGDRSTMDIYGTPRMVVTNWTDQGLDFLWISDPSTEPRLCILVLLPIQLKLVQAADGDGCGMTVAIEKAPQLVPVVFKNFNVISNWYSIDNRTLSGYTGQAGDDPAARKRLHRNTALLGRDFFVRTDCEVQSQFMRVVHGEQCIFRSKSLTMFDSPYFPSSFYDMFYYDGRRTVLRASVRCEHQRYGSVCGLPARGETAPDDGLHICAYCDSIKQLHIQ